jgi:hypothetical protein
LRAFQNPAKSLHVGKLKMQDTDRQALNEFIFFFVRALRKHQDGRGLLDIARELSHAIREITACRPTATTVDRNDHLAAFFAIGEMKIQRNPKIKFVRPYATRFVIHTVADCARVIQVSGLDRVGDV